MGGDPEGGKKLSQERAKAREKNEKNEANF